MAVVVGVGFVVLVLLAAGLTQRRGIRLRACCPADPRQDLRMKAAWSEEES